MMLLYCNLARRQQISTILPASHLLNISCFPTANIMALNSLLNGMCQKCWQTRLFIVRRAADTMHQTATMVTKPPLSSIEKFAEHKVMPPRRALLYVPGHDKRKMDKIKSLKVDCVALDCEDGVGLDKKDLARATIAEEYYNVKRTFGGELCVRINSPSSGLALQDIEGILQMETYPSTVIVPKINESDELRWFCNQYRSAWKKLNQRKNVNTHVFFMTESGRGLVNLKEIIEAGISACAQWPTCCHISGVIFGSDDFCADLEINRSNDAHELMYARQKIVATCKAYRMQAIDMVYIDYKDDEGLKRQSTEGANIGFTGKQVIHPNQIATVQECFSPTEDRIKWANDLLQAYEASTEGAFTFKGQMIDMPTVLQAKNIKKLSEKIQLSDS